jgi:hypothetical protein
MPQQKGKGRAGQDSHGTPFERGPGPGPKDLEKGAMGREASDRVEGGPERTGEDELRDDEVGEVGREGHVATKNRPR